MQERTDIKTICGVAALLAIVAALLAAFSLLGRVDVQEQTLHDWSDRSFGWSYEVLVDGAARPYEPQFQENGYMLVLPDGTEAVRITRVMEEEITDAQLGWYSRETCMEVFLDGEILYSDFGQVQRGDDGFLRPTEKDWEQKSQKLSGDALQITIGLPSDYVGKTLSVVSYFPDGYENPMPEYPYLTSPVAYVGFFVVKSLKDNIYITLYAALALLIAAMFLLDMRNSGGDSKTLLLSLYFLMQFLSAASMSFAGIYSELDVFLDTGLLLRLCMAPLYLYLALRLKGRMRVPLSCAVLLWSAYEVVCWIVVRRSNIGNADVIGPGSMIICLAVLAALGAENFRRGKKEELNKKMLAGYGLIAAAILTVYLVDKAIIWEGLGNYLLGIWNPLLQGNFDPAMEPLNRVISSMTVIAVIVEFILRTMRTLQQNSVLQERARQSLESYNRLLETEEATSAMRHEMRHHMTALSGILKTGDIGRASRYVDAVIGDLEQIPEGRYSQNMLVNVIMGSYLDQARAERIQEEHHLSVPPELNIADEDLSVFLSNMMQNALEACRRIKTGERRIKVDMHLRGKFLFIQCVNSAPDEEEHKARPGHGYGLAAMRAVAEKYNSVLVAEHTPDGFLVESDFCLNKRGTEKEENHGS